MKAGWFLRFQINESIQDRKLRISTCGRDDTFSDSNRHPYEPTPYKVLEKLATSGYIGEENTLIDYGCGKGRAPIFLSQRTGCRAIGIECEESFLSAACRNAVSARKRSDSKPIGAINADPSEAHADASQQCLFLQEQAEHYSIPPQADRLFFFNPFSVETLHLVMGKIRASCNETPREILLFFYYPSKSYDQYLRTVRELTLLEDIDCGEFFYEEDNREKIAVFRFTKQGGAHQ